MLVDGRSAYNRTFSGVFWDAQDLFIDDIERIEVIRGPGGAMWGANAVNGIINVITKTTAQTQGLVARVGGGTFDGTQAAVRYGGLFGTAAYRVYSQWSERGSTRIGPGTSAQDPWRTFTSGARVDWSRRKDSWLVDSTLQSDSQPSMWSFGGGSPTRSYSTPSVGSLLGRWTHVEETGASLQVQSFATISRRHDDVVMEKENVYDVDLQYHRPIGRRHDVVVGGGYRRAALGLAVVFSALETSRSNAVANVFAQDEISLSERFLLTIGSKFEHDDVAG